MEELQERPVRPGTASYAAVSALYEEAFPPEERIDLAMLASLADEPDVSFAAYYDADLFCGFSYSIDTGDYLYLLLLAVPSEQR